MKRGCYSGVDLRVDNWFMVERVRIKMGMVGGQQYTTVYKLMSPITSAA